ncbi:MAG: SDR family oxidoreductase [Deltaproteobacteria bacterium]|nr:SDR family oxidoreductase [Deltaproteobacteria bacterium]
MEFKDKRVIVTGGTKGLGKAIASTFAQAGAWVAANYHADTKSAETAESELKQITNNVIISKTDVASKDEVDKFIKSVINQWEHVDILVNNAGIIRDKFLMFLGEDDWDSVIETNLKGTYMTSPSAVTGRAGQTNYSASKGGIISFTKSLSKEIARMGITVNAVCPGVIETSMTDAMNSKEKDMLSGLIPMGRFGSPEDVTGAVLFLASAKAGYITGQVLTVDGGLT